MGRLILEPGSLEWASEQSDRRPGRPNRSLLSQFRPNDVRYDRLRVDRISVDRISVDRIGLDRISVDRQRLGSGNGIS